MPLIPDLSWSELRDRASDGDGTSPVAGRPPRGGLWGRRAGAVHSGLRRWLGSRVLLGLPDGIDPSDPRQAGWAVIVAADALPEARATAERLLEHRRRVTGVPDDRSQLLDYPSGCPLRMWLRMNGFQVSDIEPTRLPYYVMLVGRPRCHPV